MTYGGKRFRGNFADFIERYGMKDMYSATFYPYRTQEEKWAYWARHILLNRWEPPALPPYLQLRELVADKDSFVLTTNVDCQFYKAGFAPERIFAVQGDYGKIQCAKGCHDKLYDDETMVRQMAKEQKNCRIPSSLVPRCPVCGGEVTRRGMPPPTATSDSCNAQNGEIRCCSNWAWGTIPLPSSASPSNV